MRPQDTNGPSGATTDRLSGRAGVGRPGIACAGMYPAVSYTHLTLPTSDLV